MIDPRPEVAEAIGVFFLVFAGGAAIVGDATYGGIGVVGIALAFAFVILALVYTLGHVSGAHFNPAVTVAFAATGHFPWSRVGTYLIAQIVGASVGAFVLHWLFGEVHSVTTRVAAGLTLGEAFLVEALATAFLAFTIIGVATDRRAAPGAAGLAIGLAVGLGALFAGPFTGGSMNPSRSIGPALVAGELDHLWLYVCAPVVGAVIAMVVYELIRPGRLEIRSKEPIGALGPFPLRRTTKPSLEEDA